jgi:hypothetical protein
LAQLHTIGASAVLIAVVGTSAAAAVIALRGGSRWTDRLRIGLTLVIGLQVAIGAIAFLSGSRPAEWLHLLYGVAAVAALPLAGSFAAEAPPPDRAWVLVGACGLLLLLAWRLASTG